MKPRILSTVPAIGSIVSSARRLLRVSYIGLALAATTALATDLTWTGSVSSDWNNPANWIPQQVPTASDHVIVNPGNITIPADAAFSVMDWHAGGIGGTLVVGGGGVLNWSGGRLGVAQSLTVASNGVVNIEGDVDIYGMVTNAGTVNWQAGDLRVYNYDNFGYTGEIWNGTNALWDIQCDQGTFNPQSTPATFHNAGTLRKSANDGITSFRLYLDNRGTLAARSGTIQFNESASLGGSWLADAGAALELLAGSFTTVSGLAVSGAGTVTVTGGTLDLTQATNFISNLLLGVGASVVTGPSFQSTITNLTVASLTLDGNNVLSGTLTAGHLSIGNLTVADGGVLNWSAGQVGAARSLTVASNGVVNIEGTIDIYGIVNNAGTVNWRAGDVRLYNYYAYYGWIGEIWNETNALWDIQCGQGIYNPQSTAATFHNAGALRKSANDGITSFNIFLDNRGTVEVRNGSIQFDSGASLGGSLLADAGAALDLVAGTFTPVPGVAVSGAGTVIANGDVLDLTQATNFINNLQLGTGASIVTGPSFQSTITNLTVASLTLDGNNVLSGTLTARHLSIGNLTVADGGVLNWSAGQLGAARSLTVASNGVVNIEGTIDIYGIVNNAGTVNWRAGDVRLYNYYAYYGWIGEIWNETNGLWDIQCDQGIYNPQSTPATFHNAGTLRKSANEGITSFNIYLDNHGLVDAESGSLGLYAGFDLTGGTLAFGISNLTSYGQIYLSGNPASFDGSISAHLNGGYIPATNDTFQLLSYPAFTGSFTDTNLPALAIWKTTATATALSITVLQLVPTVTWANPADIVYGTALGGAQLNARAASPAETTGNLPGTLTYNPPLGTVLNAGANQTLSVTFTPADAATYASVTLTVAINVRQVPLTVTANSGSKTYGQAVTFAGTEFTTGGLVNGDAVTTVTLSCPGGAAAAAVAGSPYSIVPNAVLPASLANNYLITYQNGRLTVNPAPLTILANSRGKTYGQTVTFAGTEFVASGLLNSDTVTSVTLTSSGVPATATVVSSPYPIVPSAVLGTGLNNYTITYANGALAVNPAALTVTASNQTKTYGQAVTFAGTEFATSGLRNNDTVTTVTLDSPGSPAIATVAGSPYAILAGTAAGTGLDNYTITYASGTLTVNPAALTVAANNYSKSYGQANPVFAGTITGLQKGDDITATYRTTAATDSPVGVYAIVPTLVDPNNREPNYAVTENNGILTVLGATPTLTSGPQNLTVVAGSNATFMVTATGSPPLSYEWQFNGVNLSDSIHVDGSTSNLLTITSSIVGDAGNYTVIISNAFGVVTSSVAVLIVINPTATNLIVNGSFEFPGLAPDGYYFDATPIGWQVITSRSPSDVGMVKGISTYGGVWPLPEDGQQYVDLGNPGIGDVIFQIINITNQGYYALTWFGSAPDFSDGVMNSPYLVSISNASAQIVAATNVDDYHDIPVWVPHSMKVWLNPGSYTLAFQCNATPLYENCELDNVALVPASGPVAPGIASGPQDQTVGVGSNAVFSVTATGAPPLAYQWQFNQADLADDLHVSGSMSNVLTLSSVSTSDLGNYRVVITNAYGAVTSSIAFLTITNGTAPAQQTWDLAGDWNPPANPNGAWSYGFYDTNSFASYNDYETNFTWGGAGGYVQTNDASGVEIFATNGFIYKNVTGYGDFGIGSGRASLEANSGTPVARWTAPAAAYYNISLQIGGTTGVGILGFGNNFAQYAGLNINMVRQAADAFINNTMDWTITNLWLAAGATVDAYVACPGYALGGDTQTVFHIAAGEAAENPAGVGPINIVGTNSAGTSGFLLEWTAATNQLFRVRWTSVLQPASWNTFSNVITYSSSIGPTNGGFEFLDDGSQTGGFGSTRFYQLLPANSSHD